MSGTQGSTGQMEGVACVPGYTSLRDSGIGRRKSGKPMSLFSLAVVAIVMRPPLNSSRDLARKGSCQGSCRRARVVWLPAYPPLPRATQLDLRDTALAVLARTRGSLNRRWVCALQPVSRVSTILCLRGWSAARPSSVSATGMRRTVPVYRTKIPTNVAAEHAPFTSSHTPSTPVPARASRHRNPRDSRASAKSHP